MESSSSNPAGLDVLLAHVPKRSSWYKPLDEFVSVNYIAMGLFGLCDLLNRDGHRSKIVHVGLETLLDPGFSVAEMVASRGAKIVGLTLHWHYQSYDVIDVAAKIKARNPEVKIVLGGFTATRFAAEILESHPQVDFVIRGDSEKGLLALAEAVKSGEQNLSSVPNCVWRRDGGVVDNGVSYVADGAALEGLSFADFGQLEHAVEYRTYFKAPFTWSVNGTMKENLQKKVGGASTVFPLMVGRGCPVNCSFCGGSRDAQLELCGRKHPYFFRPVNDVVDTMEQAIAFGYESFIVCFDPTPANDGYYVQLFEEVRRRKLTCGMGFEAWGLPTRRLVTEFGKTFVPALSYLALSPETGSEEMRKKNKGFFYTNEQFCEAMQWIEDEGIPSLVYLTIGLPGETTEHIAQTEAFSKMVKKRFRRSCASVILLPVQLEPASPMFEDPVKYGIVGDRKCFKDFHDFHARPDGNPYTHFGYVTDSLQEAGGCPKKFAAHLNEVRCDKFCIIGPKPFGRFLPNFLSRKLCSVHHKGWVKRGFGAAPQKRPTYN